MDVYEGINLRRNLHILGLNLLMSNGSCQMLKIISLNHRCLTRIILSVRKIANQENTAWTMYKCMSNKKPSRRWQFKTFISLPPRQCAAVDNCAHVNHLSVFILGTFFWMTPIQVLHLNIWHTTELFYSCYLCYNCIFI